MWVQVPTQQLLPASFCRGDNRLSSLMLCNNLAFFALSQPSTHSSLVFFVLTETLMDSRWATTELAWTTFPESGVSK